MLLVSVLLLLAFNYKSEKAINAMFIIVVIALVGYIIMSLSPAISNAVNNRFQSMMNLEEDKTYVVRKVLVRKD